MATLLASPPIVYTGRWGNLPNSRVMASNSWPPVTTKSHQELGFHTSQFAGLKLRISQPPPLIPRRSSPPIVARRVCPFTGKKANKANRVSPSNHKTTRRQFVNLQRKKIWWEAGKRYLKLRLSTKALKTIEKNGLDAMAKKAGIDLRKK
ncbi:hypothetical protein HPP92_012403 [Vanilla planifolia]|uniref:Large ribosomal subunit protein bL28c n=1 Tax=Vanilla planifolia TaxID=51239 RepID=A0A835QWW7_VANPL|nr:hypothetical protein HPP92_012809 [Vanilla planifolia]KAG0477684.1 hypothetical protein HPP92_012403 [Vanilla planifolia]